MSYSDDELVEEKSFMADGEEETEEPGAPLETEEDVDFLSEEDPDHDR